MLQLHSSPGKLAHESSERAIFLEHEAQAEIIFFMFCAANWKGEAKDFEKVLSYAGLSECFEEDG